MKEKWVAQCDKPKARPPRMALVITHSGKTAIDCTGSGADYAEDCANANLIASAPAMLDAMLEIAGIIEQIDQRCMSADIVTPTNEEITLEEIQRIYSIVRGFH